MRRVFYALLVINLFFFGWYQFAGQKSGAVKVASKDGVESIRLLTEIGDDAEIELEKRSATQKCDVYGPFFSTLQSKSFLTATKKAGLKGRQEQERVKLKPYYWVYVRPQASLRKAQGVANRLRGYQLTAEVITEGQFRYGVSLGNFESKKLINELQQRLSKLDVTLKTKQKSRDYQQFWVLLDPGSEESIDAKLRNRLIEGYPDIFHQQKVCKPVASGG